MTPRCSPRTWHPKRLPRSGYAKDAFEIEGYVRGFARRRPDVRVTMLRGANVIGPHVTSPMTSYFRLPVIPRVLGFDPRLQFLHEDDLFGVLRHSVLTDVAGTFNVAGDGVLLLSQAIRMPGPPVGADAAVALGGVGSLLRSARLADFSPEQLGVLTYGRGVDTTRMRTVLGFEPTYTTREAFADFAALLGRSRRPAGGPSWVTPRSSPSGPAAVRAAAPASSGRPRRPATWSADAATARGGAPRQAGPLRPPAAAQTEPTRPVPPSRPGSGAAPRRPRPPRTGPDGRDPRRRLASGHPARRAGQFGHDWEGQLAHLLAYWRRRLDGDYVVDEYGFDAEFTATS